MTDRTSLLHRLVQESALYASGAAWKVARPAVVAGEALRLTSRAGHSLSEQNQEAGT